LGPVREILHVVCDKKSGHIMLTAVGTRGRITEP
jgi:hypothetical protein